MSTPDVPLPADLKAAFTASPELPTPLPPDPFPIFAEWFAQAKAAGKTPNPDAMCLATVDPDGQPSARIVLCRGIDAARGHVTFFTNYESRKGVALAHDARAAATFHWDHADRQVRLEGVVTKSPSEESDAYFKSRLWESRLSAWTSAQSRPTSGRPELLVTMARVLERFGITPATAREAWMKVPLPRPGHWGGYRLLTSRVELWLGGTGRLHDRAVWTRSLTRTPSGEVLAGAWSAMRLQP
ncbi:MAG: pyridoxine/pyridoxamine 5'-phosphate oxidase [Phycisphaerae bacterium]|nr:MAG: pyridoxine/pyridoxamine 5'-phosphate oxidase [Phycisphaerae bacterium]